MNLSGADRFRNQREIERPSYARSRQLSLISKVVRIKMLKKMLRSATSFAEIARERIGEKGEESELDANVRNFTFGS